MSAALANDPASATRTNVRMARSWSKCRNLFVIVLNEEIQDTYSGAHAGSCAELHLFATPFARRAHAMFSRSGGTYGSVLETGIFREMRLNGLAIRYGLRPGKFASLPAFRPPQPKITSPNEQKTHRARNYNALIGISVTTRHNSQVRPQAFRSRLRMRYQHEPVRENSRGINALPALQLRRCSWRSSSRLFG